MHGIDFQINGLKRHNNLSKLIRGILGNVDITWAREVRLARR